MNQKAKPQKVLKFATEEAASLGSRHPDKEYKRIVYAEVYAPMRPDTDGMYMTAEDIEIMAHNFLADGFTDQVDLQHDNVLVPGASIVESFIAREGDTVFLPGSWVVGIRVNNDDVWQQVLDGKINGFSVQAEVFFEETDVRLKDTENEVTGHTSIDEGHSHKFVVWYNEQGSIIGGETDTVDGHKHLITVSTNTRKATSGSGVEHKHVFASVDNLILEEVE